ncbi:MAG TPA: hypothetical protein P5232_02190 [Candidatus Moranbacteria bacterium]|nr:hypothetical protein [Candidatus Moranbacteria bacterium]
MALIDTLKYIRMSAYLRERDAREKYLREEKNRLTQENESLRQKLEQLEKGEEEQKK